MENTNGFEEEKTELLSKIDALKKQIKTFESELGINTEDLLIKPSMESSRVLRKVRESKGRLGAIESAVRTETDLQVPAAAGNAIVEQPLELAGPARVISADEFEKKTSELKKRSEQIAQISSLVSKLRSDMLSRETLEKSPQVQPKVQKSETQKPAVAEPVHVQETKPKAERPSYSAQDLPAIATLVQKLNDLVRENAKISEELREMITENRNVNKANKVSELVKKLALAGLNG